MNFLRILLCFIFMCSLGYNSKTDAMIFSDGATFLEPVKKVSGGGALATASAASLYVAYPFLREGVTSAGSAVSGAWNNTTENLFLDSGNSLVNTAVGASFVGASTFCSHLCYKLVRSQWNKRTVPEAGKLGAGVSLAIMGLPTLVNASSYFVNMKNNIPFIGKIISLAIGGTGATLSAMCLAGGYQLLKQYIPKR